MIVAMRLALQDSIEALDAALSSAAFQKNTLKWWGTEGYRKGRNILEGKLERIKGDLERLSLHPEFQAV